MSVNHTVNVGDVIVAACEWCAEPASLRITVLRRGHPPYKRFACANTQHRVKTSSLVTMDLGAGVKRETIINPTGFNVQGRVLGSKGCS
jgi:hypothetical protein